MPSKVHYRPIAVVLGVLLVLVLVSGVHGPAWAASIDPSGIELVDKVTQAQPTSEKQAQAFDDAMRFAAANGTDVGYPWINPVSNALELSAATGKGRNALSAIQSDVEWPNAVRDVKFSIAALEQIADEVTTLRASGVSDADLIYETAPDHEQDRMIITVTKPSAALFSELAQRFGTEAIAVRVNPDNFDAGTASRQSDGNPFWGGARIGVPVGTCTDAFSWYIDATHSGMLTAGHCAPNGGSVSTPASSMGTVTATSDENWSTSDGTQHFPGDTAYRGDLAVIRIYSGKSSSPYIYRGSSNSNTFSTVKSMFPRSPVVGDTFYTGGERTGELGPWTVTTITMNKWYTFDGLNVWARNVTEGTKGGSCIDHGDSGGSVFTLTTGGVSAKGIISGMGFITCYVYFTDIWQAYIAFPGVLKVN